MPKRQSAALSVHHLSTFYVQRGFWTQIGIGNDDLQFSDLTN